MKTVTVELPTEDTVLAIVSDDISDAASKHGFSGYINPSLLAPYLLQPRLYIDPVELKELQDSIAGMGVRDELIVTPMATAPWAKVAPDDMELPYLIVSGHRRTEAALIAGLKAVPFQVRVYKTKSEFDDDAGILNDHRANLSEIEEGYRFRSRIEGGEKITHLVKTTGMSFQHIKRRMALTYLAPGIQELVSPRLRSRERLAIGFASALGEAKALETVELIDKLESLGDLETDPEFFDEDNRRFCLQRAYLTYCQKQGWGGIVSETFVRTGKRPEQNYLKTVGASSRKNGVATPELHLENGMLFNGHNVRDDLVTWCQVVKQFKLGELELENLQKEFEYALPEDLKAIAGILEDIQKDVSSTAKCLRAIAQNKPGTHPEVLKRSLFRKEQAAIAG